MAVTVTLAPEVRSLIVIAGVLSEVTLSVFEDPLSDAAARSGVPVRGMPTAVAAADNEVADPALLVEVSEYRMYFPTSAVVSVYVVEVAPEMAVQSPGMEVLVDAAGDVQRYHCEVSVGVGVPLNVAVPVSVCPNC